MMFREDPVSGGIQYGEHGVVAVPETPGLGASLDAGYLQKLSGFVVS